MKYGIQSVQKANGRINGQKESAGERRKERGEQNVVYRAGNIAGSPVRV
jgi:hypothetical protein